MQSSIGCGIKFLRAASARASIAVKSLGNCAHAGLCCAEKSWVAHAKDGFPPGSSRSRISSCCHADNHSEAPPFPCYLNSLHTGIGLTSLGVKASVADCGMFKKASRWTTVPSQNETGDVRSLFCSWNGVPQGFRLVNGRKQAPAGYDGDHAESECQKANG